MEDCYFEKKEHCGAGRKIEICKTCAEVGEPMSFSHALAALVANQSLKARRRGWNVDGKFIQLQHPDDKSKINMSYFYLSIPHGEKTTEHETITLFKVTPWTPSHADLLADDWILTK